MSRTVPDDSPGDHYETFNEPTVVSDGDGGTLSAAIGTRTSTADGGGQLVFFWHNDRFIGWNTDHESFKLNINAAAGGDKVEVDYIWLRPTDAGCCPTGLDTLTYRWDGSALQPDRELPGELAGGVHVHLTE